MSDPGPPLGPDAEVKKDRIAVLGVTGVGALYWSWSTAHSAGYSYPALAMLGPAVSVVAA
jgi:hypothetical protein